MHKGLKMKWLKYGITVLIILSLASVIWYTDLAVIKNQLHLIGRKFWVVIFLSSMSYFLGSLAWKYCFYQYEKVSLWKLFYVRTIGEVIAFINPTSIIAGEASKVYLLDSTPIPMQDKVDSVILSRIVLISTQLTLFFICVIWLLFVTVGAKASILTSGAIVVLFVTLTLVVTRALRYQRNRDTHKVARCLYYLVYQAKRFHIRIKRFARTNGWQLLAAVGITTVHWGVGATELLYILHLLHIDVSFISALSVDMGIVVLKSAAGFVPGQVGIEEFGNKYLLEVIGVNVIGIWLSVSIIRRARQLFWIAISTCFYLIKMITKKQSSNGRIIYNT